MATETLEAPPTTTQQTPPVTTQADPPPSERSQTDWLGDTEADFADMDAGRQPAPKKAAERDDKGQFVKPPEKRVEAPPETKVPEGETKTGELATKSAEDATKGATAEIKPVKAADLRTAYEGLKKKVKEEYEPKVQSLTAKVAELESRKPEDGAPILQKMKALEERNAALEKHIEYLDFQESDNFTKNFAEPYRQAWAKAVSDFKGMRVKEADGEDEMGNPKFKSRPADENDLVRLANMSISDMDVAANEMFGYSAARAIGHIAKIQDLATAQSEALETAKKTALETRQRRQLEAKSQNETVAKAWTEVNKSLEDKYPKAFHVEPTDVEDKAAHTKGFALADLNFIGPAALSPEAIEALPTTFRDTIKAKQPLTPLQRVQLHALARLKMANHDRQVVRNRKLTARVAELEKTVKEYEDSEPSARRAGGGGGSGGGPPRDPQEVVADELRALDK